jgi:hypothetical protein
VYLVGSALVLVSNAKHSLVAKVFWANYSAALGLSFLIMKVGLIIVLIL